MRISQKTFSACSMPRYFQLFQFFCISCISIRNIFFLRNCLFVCLFGWMATKMVLQICQTVTKNNKNLRTKERIRIYWISSNIIRIEYALAWLRLIFHSYIKQWFSIRIMRIAKAYWISNFNVRAAPLMPMMHVYVLKMEN